MKPLKSFLPPAAVLILPMLLPAPQAHSAALDLTLEYRGRALSYLNPSLDPARKGSSSFISERARVGFLIKKISLETVEGTESSMEVGFVLQALDVAGSTSPVQSPQNKVAARYPSSDFSPFIENAYFRILNAAGSPWDITIGRQPAKVGSGLTLSDDGLGMSGISARRKMAPWGAQLFYYQPKSGGSSSGKLHLAGASLDIPLDGTLSVSEVMEKDRTGPVEAGIALKSATRHFMGLRYQISREQFAFEGEGALQRGSASPAAAGAKGISYSGSAALLSGIWKQDLGKFGVGKARLSVGEGSGDDPLTAGKNEGFFPSYGHRYDGLERDGWGDFFGASLYDAIGPSTTTANGLPAGVSGVRVIRIGLTPPAFNGIILDIDYFLFQALRAPGNRNLGNEYDIRLSYSVKDRLQLRFLAAFFSAGKAISAKNLSSRLFGFEASGRF